MEQQLDFACQTFIPERGDVDPAMMANIHRQMRRQLAETLVERLPLGDPVVYRLTIDSHRSDWGDTRGPGTVVNAKLRSTRVAVSHVNMPMLSDVCDTPRPNWRGQPITPGEIWRSIKRRFSRFFGA